MPPTPPPDPGLYDLFVSYSNQDNLPPPGGREGWVRVFIQRIRALAVEFTAADISTTANRQPDWDTFYAPDEIHAGQLWEPRLRAAVAQTRVLLACLSEHYWQSKWCRIEWETYLQQESARGLANLQGGITPIYIATAPGLSAAAIVAAAPDWARQLLDTRQVCLLEFQTHGLDAIARIRALHDDPVTLDGLGNIAARVSQQIAHARFAEKATWAGNLVGGTDTFVGRGGELGKIETQLFKSGALGVITALRGLGGQGKTALALRYGQNLRTRYSGGCWQVIAEGRAELLPLLASLREPLGLGTLATETETDTAHRVLTELHRRAFDPAFPRDPGHAAAALLVVDNVDDPRLLAATQREALRKAMLAAGPGGTGWLHLLATTRLEKRDLSFLNDDHLIPVDALPEADALDLWQRILAGEGGTLPPAELDSARAIIVELECHTLAIEVAARFIRLHRDDGETGASYLARLRAALTAGPGRFAENLSAHQREEQTRDLLPGYTHALESTLRFTFDRLARDHPAAATVLHYAAHFPAEAVPMPWLRLLAGQHHPELLEPDDPAIPGEWQKAALRLTESLRLLTPTDAATPEVARLHRLAAEFLRYEAQQAGTDEARTWEVETLIVERCKEIQNHQQIILPPWERTVVLVDLPARMSQPDCPVEIAQAGCTFASLLSAYVSIPMCRSLVAASCAIFQHRLQKEPDDLVLLHSLAMAFQIWAKLARSHGDLKTAMVRFSESITIQKRLVEERPTDTMIQGAYAATLGEMGYVAKTAGDRAGALQCYTESKDIFRHLVSSDPSNTVWESNLSVALNEQGALFEAQGDLPGALESFAESLALTRRLVSRDPTSPLLLRSVAYSLMHMGDINGTMGNLANAFHLCTEAKSIFELVATMDTYNSIGQIDLATVHGKLGEIATKQGDLSGAHHHFTECKLIAARLVASDANNVVGQDTNVVWQECLAGSSTSLGELAFSQRDFSQALLHFTEAMEIRERLASMDPSNAASKLLLSKSLCNLGKVALSEGDFPTALSQFSEANSIVETLAASDPDSMEWQRERFVSRNQLGDLFLVKDDLTSARHRYEQVLVDTRSLAARDPGNAHRQRDLSMSLEKLGTLAFRERDFMQAMLHFTEAKTITQRLADHDNSNVGLQGDISVLVQLMKQSSVALELQVVYSEAQGESAWKHGDVASAERRFTERREIAECLVNSDPGNANWQRKLTDSLDRLGDLAMDQGDLAGAFRYVSESKAIAERLATTDPTNVGWQRDIWMANIKLGDLATAQGDIPAAFDYWAKAGDIPQRLAASDPANAEWQRDLSVSLEKLGDLAVAQGDLAGALRCFSESKTIGERLAASDPANAAWQRDLAVSHFKLYQFAQKQGDEAMMQAELHATFLVLDGMKRRGLHMDAPSANLHEQLAGMFGAE
ncbi:MAG: TIR domain-containing protein [Verrucomicrobia bacterium]|nr:TIR domain-containing protein [Verrucomicrobiota bacterium]